MAQDCSGSRALLTDSSKLEVTMTLYCILLSQCGDGDMTLEILVSVCLSPKGI